MGFHAVATGYLLKKDGDIRDYIHVIARRIVHKKTGQEFEGKLQIDNVLKVKEDIDNYDIIFREDIMVKNGEYFQEENLRIKIGPIRSGAIMIYFEGDENQVFTDKEIFGLIMWKKRLVTQERVPDDIMFASLPNCSSSTPS